MCARVCVTILQAQHFALFVEDVCEQFEAVAHRAALATAEMDHMIEVLRKRFAGRQAKIAFHSAIDFVQRGRELAPLLERDDAQQNGAELLDELNEIVAPYHRLQFTTSHVIGTANWL